MSATLSSFLAKLSSLVMGNESSSEMDESGGTVLQTQGEEDLWTLRLHRGPGGEGEGVCVFTRKPGDGAQAELCANAVEVWSWRSVKLVAS